MSRDGLQPQPTVAGRLRGLEASPTLVLAAKAKSLAKDGKPVVDFTAGEPDFPTPRAIKDAAIRAIEANQTKYTPAAGIAELRGAIAQDVNHRLGTKFGAAEVMVSCGAKHALYNVLQAICEPGDEVVILAPYWVSYEPLVRLADAIPKIVATREAEGFQPDPSAIESAITSRTKTLILNSP
ncbi:MAG: aminotransferase class I/II-fold pyridoxal phosphate-dependent enzyme, partial [Candidatus Omnitrophica bacterium]|nr:aminotransferase class I/II-fold pyridoxal phosphate-dependent enzyme [Candidatus Omnitrophota bacterium]